MRTLWSLLSKWHDLIYWSDYLYSLKSQTTVFTQKANYNSCLSSHCKGNHSDSECLLLNGLLLGPGKPVAAHGWHLADIFLIVYKPAVSTVPALKKRGWTWTSQTGWQNSNCYWNSIVDLPPCFSLTHIEVNSHFSRIYPLELARLAARRLSHQNDGLVRGGYVRTRWAQPVASSLTLGVVLKRQPVVCCVVSEGAWWEEAQGSMDVLKPGRGWALPQTWVACDSVAVKSWGFTVGPLAPCLIRPFTDCENLGKLHSLFLSF